MVLGSAWGLFAREMTILGSMLQKLNIFFPSRLLVFEKPLKSAVEALNPLRPVGYVVYSTWRLDEAGTTRSLLVDEWAMFRRLLTLRQEHGEHWQSQIMEAFLNSPIRDTSPAPAHPVSSNKVSKLRSMSMKFWQSRERISPEILVPQ